jgi:hypothetical protein
MIELEGEESQSSQSMPSRKIIGAKQANKIFSEQLNLYRSNVTIQQMTDNGNE